MYLGGNSSQAGFWWSSLGHSCSHLERPSYARYHFFGSEHDSNLRTHHFCEWNWKTWMLQGCSHSTLVFWWFGRSIWPARKWDKWPVWSKMKKLKKLKLHLMCLQRMMSWRWPAMKNFIPHVGSAAWGRFGMWTRDSTNISFRKLWQRGVWAEGITVDFLTYLPFDLVLFALDCHLFHTSCHNLDHGSGPRDFAEFHLGKAVWIRLSRD